MTETVSSDLSDSLIEYPEGNGTGSNLNSLFYCWFSFFNELGGIIITVCTILFVQNDKYL